MNSRLFHSLEALNNLLYLIRLSIDEDPRSTHIYLDFADEVMKNAHLELGTNLRSIPALQAPADKERR